MKYFLFILVGCALGFLAAKLFIKPKELAPVVIHTDTYKPKYEAANALIYKQYLKIDSLKNLQKQKYIIVYEKTNDSIPTNNIPRSFTELADYLNK
jgi:hypothetical protein